MSGGSYGYVSIAQDFDTLIARRAELRDLRDDLATHPDSAAAVAATDAFLARLDEVERAIRAAEAAAHALTDVWRAVEWRASRDVGPDAVARALAAFNATR